MRPVFLALSLPFALGASLASQQRPPRDQPPAPLVGTAVIAGIVATDEAGTRPVGRAQLLIVGTDTGYMKIAQADDQGRFTLADLPAGRYLLGAAKASYLNAAYGAKRPGRPGTAISVTDGQRIPNLVLMLTPGGVMSGVVTDERGHPAPGAVVRLQKIGTKAAASNATGGLALAMMMEMGGTNGRTDDRGAYRLYGVEPGEYAIVVTMANSAPGDVRVLTADDIQAGLQALRDPSRTAGGPGRTAAPPVSTILPPTARPSNDNPFPGLLPSPMMAGPVGSGPTVGYAPVYYPGTPELAEAGSITIAAGEERTGLDIRTMLVPTARVECLVVPPDGQPATNVQVSLRPIAGNASTSLFSMLTAQQFFAKSGLGGHYTFSGVPPGRYSLMARTSPAGMGQVPVNPAAPPSNPLWGTTDVIVNGQNVSGLVLTLQPGMTLSGRVVFNSEKLAEPKEKDLRVSVGVRPLRLDSNTVNFALTGNTMVNADRTFTIAGLVPSQYLLSGAVTPNGAANLSDRFLWSMQSVTVGGKDVLDLPIDLKPNEEIKDAVITFTDRQQEVFGTLQDATGRPAPDYTVVLFAADTRYWFPNSRRILIARPATDGRFEISGGSFDVLGGGSVGLPPGDYFLAAVTDLGGGEQYDVKMLEELAKTSVKITVAPGEKKRQDVRMTAAF